MTKKIHKEWEGKGFTKDQINEIEEGLRAGLPVELYARPEYYAIQMRQIRFGLEEKVPAELYARPEYDWFQMEEIRLGLQDGIDIYKYADPGIPYEKMRQLRLGFLSDIDLSEYLQMDAGVLRELRISREKRLNILPYIKEGYENEQLKQIRISLEKGVDIDPYLVKELRGPSISEICAGLEKGLDVAVYARVEFGWQQMREIRLGMENRIDVKKYADPFYNWQQMREIRLGMEQGIDTSGYDSLLYTAAEMKKIRHMLGQQNELVADSQEIFRQEETECFRDYDISISLDEMEAYIEVHTTGQGLQKEELRIQLQQSGIKNGIIEEELDRLAAGNYFSHPILIAKGVTPGKGEDGWYEYFFRTKQQRKPKLLPDGSVDYQNTRWYEPVTEGQKLICYHGAKTGTGGYTVTGRFLTGKKGREQPMLYGRGFTLSADRKTYRAAISGKADLYGRRLEVTRLLQVDDVSYTSGNIEFDGTVHIKGNVGSGTIIRATEDVLVEGYVESAVIESMGNIVLKQGVNGSGSGIIKAAHSVSGGFFESAQIYAGEDIQANYCMNSELYAEGSIHIRGREGVLVGGRASAVKGITAGHVGNRVGLKTILRLGINENMYKQKKKLDERIKEEAKELALLRNAYTDLRKKYLPEVRNTMEKFLKVENAIFTKEKQLEEWKATRKELTESWKHNKNVKIVITGRLYAGVVVQIDNVIWTAKEIQNVTLKKVDDRIAVFTNR